MKKEENEEEPTPEEKETEETAETDGSQDEGTEEIEDLLKEEDLAEETAETEEEAAPVEEEEVKPRKRRKKEEEEEFVEERVYTIPLGKASIRPPKKRAPRAMQMLKAFVTKHMKLAIHVEEEEEKEELPKLIISNEVNERVWNKGIEKPPRKIRVRAAKDKDGNVTVFLAEGE
jgi:large subunit ribosomal protein L31e